MVLVLIGVLSAVTIPTYLKVTANSNNNNAIQTLRVVQLADQRVASLPANNGYFPSTIADPAAVVCNSPVAGADGPLVLPCSMTVVPTASTGTKVISGSYISANYVVWAVLSSSGICEVMLDNAATQVPTWGTTSAATCTASWIAANYSAVTGSSGSPTALSVTPIAPNAPTIGSATIVSAASVSVSFTPASSGPAASSYTVTSNTGGFSATGTSSPLVINASFHPGTSYTFSVVAYNGINSVASAASNSVLPNQGTPNAPTIGAASPTAPTAVSVSFSPPVTGSTPTSYTVTSSPGGFSASGSSSPIVVTGSYTQDTSYTFSVTSYVGASASPSASSASNSVVPNIGVSYLIVGGGGGGGDNAGGGGGGVVSGSGFNPSFGTAYTITVGAGGQGGGWDPNNGLTEPTPANGGSSVFASFTAQGGGAAGYNTGTTFVLATSGGSGGGGEGGSAGTTAGGSGTSGQGNSGGAGLSSLAGGGGGGAGGAGSTATTGFGGGGGVGVSSSITGTATYYGGGGGGGANTSISAAGGAAGGSGGGGRGGYNTGRTTPGVAPVAGTSGLGGGGGGCGGFLNNATFGPGPYVGAAGGSGIVIVTYLTTSHPTAPTVTGSPTATTNGLYTVYKWTSSGTIKF